MEKLLVLIKFQKLQNHFCYKYIVGKDKTAKGGLFHGSNKVKACYKEIIGKKAYGWPIVYCAANTLISKDPSQCYTGAKANPNCILCVNDIQDYGWQYAYDKWDIFKNTGSGPLGICISINQLPPDLLECESGIRIQYDNNGVWTTYKAIPSGYRLCPGSGSFNSANDFELFSNMVRIAQCGPMYETSTTTCPNSDITNCDAEEGLSLTINVQVTNGVSQVGIVNLINTGVLICSPSLYPNQPKGCLNQPVVPCEGCKGTCPIQAYVPPCTDCGMCPLGQGII